jgi:hypothetical protein
MSISSLCIYGRRQVETDAIRSSGCARFVVWWGCTGVDNDVFVV